MSWIRHIVILVLVIIYQNDLNAQADTTVYLRDTLQPKANIYVGQPLDVLLNDLKIKVVSFQGIYPWQKKNIPDTVTISDLTLEFYPTDKVIDRVYKQVKTPHIYIEFTTPVKIPKVWFSPGKSGYWEWKKSDEVLFRPYIISKLEVRGI